MAAVDPILDPSLPPPDELPGPSLWRNPAFQRVWAAATISIFGSLITRMALPFIAIIVLSANTFDVALVRSMDLLAGLAVGLVAGAWVDRLRRRPVLIWADLGRAAILLSIPIAALGGWLSLVQLLAVAFLVAVLTTFFDAADHAFLPTVVDRRDLLRANGALTASASVSEFAGFGAAGFLVQILSGPLTVLIDAVTYVISAVLLWSVRVVEPAPRPKAEREPVLQEIALGLRIVARDPIVRPLTLATMALAGLWGIFGATWYLFAIDDLGLDPAAIGLIAAAGGLSSLGAALLTPRVERRLGLGRLLIVALLISALGNLFIPLAPAGAPLLAVGCLLAQQLIGDAGATAFAITDVSIRQSVVEDRELGRVNASVRVGELLVSLVCTLGAGALALVIGLRMTMFLAPLGGLIAAAIIWFSQVRRLSTLDQSRAG